MMWLHNKDNGNIFSVLENSPEHAFLSEVNSVVDGRDLYEELSWPEVTSIDANEPFAKFTIAKYLGAVNTAAGDVNTSLGLCPADGSLVSAAVVVSAAVAGQATNFRTLTLFNDGTPANAGAAYAQVVAASVASLALSAGTVNLATGQENVLTTGTAAVHANDILRFGSIHSGTGLVVPDMVLIATFSRTS